MHDRTITALFERRDDAMRAIEALCEEAGLDSSDVQVDDASSLEPQPAEAAERSESRGLFSSLRELFVPDDDNARYAAAARQGGFVVAARIAEAQIGAAIDILERNGAVDLDQRDEDEVGMGAGSATMPGGPAIGSRESDHRGVGASGMDDAPLAAAPRSASDHRGLGTKGMDAEALGSGHGDGEPRGSGDRMGGLDSPGSRAGATAYASAGAGAGFAEAVQPLERGPAEATGAPIAASQGGTRTPGPAAEGDREESIPVVEEQLRVDRRAERTGRVRVRSYVVSTPVQEVVTLRDRTAEVERRPASGRSTDADPFRERSIEVEERSERAVVTKEVHVREEVVVRSRDQERLETIDDTVRRTEVEIDHDSGLEDRALQQDERGTRRPGASPTDPDTGSVMGGNRDATEGGGSSH